jgi:periplasmic divalent cation tolerance protein
MTSASTEPQYGVVLVTASSQAEAMAIAEALVGEKLAACVSVTPIHSTYTWQGEVHRDQEWQLMIKTDLACFEAIAAKVQSIHSYEVPELIALPIVAGSPAYLQWIGEQVKP